MLIGLERGNQLASKVYRSPPRQEQVYAVFKELKRLAVLGIKEGRSEADVLALLHRRVEKSRAVKKTSDVMVQPVVGCKEERIKKTPRLFRVYGGRVIQARQKGKSATAAGVPLRDRPAAQSAKGIIHNMWPLPLFISFSLG